MFERYDEKARRAIFFARYEASQFGTQHIETEHLLLGLLRDDKALAIRLLGSLDAIQAVRKRIQDHTPPYEKISTSVDLPLSHESKRVLAYGLEESERFSHHYIGTLHLFAALLREKKSFAAQLLRELGVTPAKVRAELERVPPRLAPESPTLTWQPRALSLFTRDLTAQAAEVETGPAETIDPVVNVVLQVLGRRQKRNPVLVGDDPAVKLAIATRLAQRIASGEVPQMFSNASILLLDLAQVAIGSSENDPVPERLGRIFNELTHAPESIVFLPNPLETLFGARSDDNWKDVAVLLAPALNIQKMQFICTATAAGFQSLTENHPTLAAQFGVIEVPPLLRSS